MRRFTDAFEALESLRPFVTTVATKHLFLKGRNGAWCVLSNGPGLYAERDGGGEASGIQRV